MLFKSSKRYNRYIHLLWCTVRPGQFKKMHKIWMRRAVFKEAIKTYVAVNSTEHASNLQKYLRKEYLLVLNIDRIGVCYPAYILSKGLGVHFGRVAKDDIVILASDDFIPPKRWDVYLDKKLKDKSEACLLVRDGYQEPDSGNTTGAAITIPILTVPCLLALNRIIYHPAYTHMFSDCELYSNVKEMNLLVDDRFNDETAFYHIHHSNRKRKSDFFDHVHATNWGKDREVWLQRQSLTLEERLRTPEVEGEQAIQLIAR